MQPPTGTNKQSARRTKQQAHLDAAAEHLDVDPARFRRVVAKAAERFDDVSMVASREADRRDELAAHVDPLISVPWSDGDVHDLVGLAEIAERLRAG